MKFWKYALGAGSALALLAQPVVAQETASPENQAEMIEAMQAMFPKEPLTAEEESRLPQAKIIIDKMIPPGTLGEMMGGMFDGMMGPMMEMDRAPSEESLTKELGLAPAKPMSADQIEEASLLLDPVREEREARMTAMMPGLMTGMMRAMEPIMREAMIEVYAANFTTRELTDINAFFQTETGRSYAKKSLSLQQDPRLIGAIMQSMPVIASETMAMTAKMDEALADLPKVRGYADLSPSQRARLEALTGLDQESLKTGLEMAAQQREQSRQSLEGF